jgi:hypothetical protein
LEIFGIDILDLCESEGPYGKIKLFLLWITDFSVIVVFVATIHKKQMKTREIISPIHPISEVKKRDFII